MCFSRASIVRDLNSIREKYMMAKVSILIFDRFCDLLRAFLGVFGHFLSSLLFAHSRKIHARDKYTFYSMRWWERGAKLLVCGRHIIHVV